MEKNKVIKKEDILKSATLRVGEISLHKNGFIITKINDDVVIDVNDVKEMAEKTVEIAGSIGKPVLVLSGLRVDITKEAREFPIEKAVEYPHVASAEAIVVEDLATRIMAHFYYMFRKPLHDYKVFSNAADAIKWLEKFKK